MPKDHIEEIDVQEPFFAIVNCPISELYGTLVCRIRYFSLSATRYITGNCFPGYGVWVTVDFDSKYKILWGETRAHGVPFHEKKTSSNTRICIIIPTPYHIRLTHMGGRGVTVHCGSADKF